jgi:prephenate dehydrogenase
VVVAGLGLVGGSVARALHRAGYFVVGVDRTAVLRRARAAGVIRAGYTDLAAALAGADVLLLAAPPRATLRLLAQAARVASPDLVITDCTSVKREIVREARRLGLRGFVGGHPVAGNEGRGFAASSVAMFRGRAWVLTPEGASAKAVRAVRALVRATGARPVTMSAARHDRVLAYLSHLPQVVAWALYGAAKANPAARRHLALAGPGFHDMTRLHRSPRALWREILAGNQDELRRSLRTFARALRAYAPPVWISRRERRRPPAG